MTVSDISQDGDTALIVASRKGHYDLCVDLIQAGALLDVQNKVGHPLPSLSFPSSPLLPHFCNQLGRTALMEACCYGHLYVVQLLIYADADHQLTDRVSSLISP